MTGFFFTVALDFLHYASPLLEKASHTKDCEEWHQEPWLGNEVQNVQAPRLFELQKKNGRLCKVDAPFPCLCDVPEDATEEDYRDIYARFHAKKDAVEGSG